MADALDLTREILDGYSPYRHPDDEIREALYWAEAKWTACRASIASLFLSKTPTVWDPVHPEWLAWDASQMICDQLGPVEIYLRADAPRSKR